MVVGSADDDVLIVDAGATSNIDQEPEATQEGKASDGERTATGKSAPDEKIQERSKSTKDERFVEATLVDLFNSTIGWRVDRRGLILTKKRRITGWNFTY